MWSKIDNEVKRITLDIYASGSTGNDTAEGINVPMMKLDTLSKFFRITGQHSDAGGGGTRTSLVKCLQTCDRIDILVECLQSICSNHRLNLTAVFKQSNALEQVD